ncbi:T9SS type A sorting domain-containing protein [Neolewinella agarilytica]|uniref:Por secretion system C-terminal sorting domain-containing protein n=1 Tax=Neolewinella agarilytica TaxID=478744 RepID=A0A1H8ZH90_9BACT|nr:YCF48-related protein [Neolewinella agarilytica]SEP63108.1 Por secretion system C-terminal sorting domain-containing protein [Neolewinella agarilytica]
MKSPLFALVGILLFSTSLSSQIDPSVYPVGYASKLQDVHVDDMGAGYAGGSCGVLLYSSGNAADWQLVDGPAGGDEQYSSVACPPGGCATAALVVVGGIDLYRQQNGGAWRSIETEVEAGNLHWLTNTTVFASGNSSNALRSTDGGNTWVNITLPEFASSNFYFLDSNIGFYGTNERLYKTTDGGVTWTATGYDHPASIRLITWLDENTGFIFDSPRDFYGTTDGGQTFTKRNTERLPASFVWMEALSADRVLGGAVVSVIQETLDGGVTWARTSPSGAERFNRGVHRRGNDLFAANSYNQIMYLAEGAAEWIDVNEHPRGTIEEISFATPTVGYAAANGTPNLIKTTDAGQTWIPTGQQIRTFRLLALSANELIIIVNGDVRISRDGGDSFVDLLPIGVIPDGESISDFYLKPNGELYLHGTNYSVTVSADGNSFNPVQHDLGLSASELFFLDNNFGALITTAEAAITQDGGATWTMTASPGRNLRGIFFADKLNGWASNASTRYITSDGGMTWGTGNSIAGGYDYRRRSNGDIYVSEWSGNDGLLMRSTDNGQTWTTPARTCFGHRSGEMTPDGKYYFTGGDGGYIVRHDLEAITTSLLSPRTLNVSHLKVYPNPTSGLVTVELPTNTTEGTIELFDASGRMLRAESIRFAEATHQMDIQGLPAGVYQLRFTSANGANGISRIVLR